MKQKFLWYIQFFINEWFMLKLMVFLVSFVDYDIEEGWDIVISFFLVIVFLLLGYAFTKKFEND